MRTLTAVTTESLVNMLTSDSVPATDCAEYVYIGNGKFEPCNAAAWREIAAWNAYADMWNARTATRSAP